MTVKEVATLLYDARKHLVHHNENLSLNPYATEDAGDLEACALLFSAEYYVQLSGDDDETLATRA